MREDTVVYAVACVGEDDFAESDPDSPFVDLDGAERSEFGVVSVDRTGTRGRGERGSRGG